MFKLFKKKFDIPEAKLIHVFTFKSGEKLYTYDPKDIGNIHSRYQRNIREAIKYLELFAVTKETWTVTCEKVDTMIVGAIGAKDVKSKDKALLEINSIFTWFNSALKGVKTQDDALAEMFFCCFYLLEHEKPFGYNEALNEKKIALLNENLDAREFFFQNLEPLTNNGITLEYLYNTSIEQYHLLCYSTILEFDKRNKQND
jgi:hypothetical protein